MVAIVIEQGLLEAMCGITEVVTGLPEFVTYCAYFSKLFF